MVLGFCPFPHCHLYIYIYIYTKFDLKATVVLKLFAGQGTGRTDGQSGDYMLPPLWSLKIGNMYTCCDKNGAETMYIAEHNNSKCYVQSNLKYIQKTDA